MILSPIGNQGNYFGKESRLATRVQWIENWRPRSLHFMGEHSMQMGSVLAHAEDAGSFIARPVVIEDSTGQLASRIDFSGAGSFAVSDLEPSLYVQDHWVLRPNSRTRSRDAFGKSDNHAYGSKCPACRFCLDT